MVAILSLSLAHATHPKHSTRHVPFATPHAPRHAPRRAPRHTPYADDTHARQLIATINEHFGDGLCPFLPPSYLWQKMKLQPTWQETIRSQPRWLLKTTEHRGQGVMVVTAKLILDARNDVRNAWQADRNRASEMLRRPDTV